MAHRVLFACLLICGLIVSGTSHGFADDKEDLEVRYFDDEILDKMRDFAIGAELVPLSQVRQEFQKIAPDSNIELLAPPDDKAGDKLSLEALQDIASRDEIAERLHPLVPAQGKPCTGEGLVVSSVVSNGPAANAGIRRGDVIYSINGKKTTTLNDLKTSLAKVSDGGNFNLKVGVASYDPSRTTGISETSARAWKRQVVVIKPELERYVLLDPLDRKPDPIDNNDLYTHKDVVTIENPMVMTLDFFRPVNSKPTSLYLTVRYAGKSWIFFNHITVRADGQVFEMDVARDDLNTNVADDATVSESVNLAAHQEEHKKLLNAVLSAKKVLVRFSGKEGLHDVEVALAERAKMEEVFKIYTRLLKD